MNIRKNIYRAIAIIGGLVTVTVSYAQVVTPAIPQEYIDRIKINTRRDQVTAQVTGSVAVLSMLVTKTDALQNVPPADKAALKKEIQTQLSMINSLKSAIVTETKMETLNNELSAIQKTYSTIKFYKLKVGLMYFADNAMVLSDEMGTRTQNQSALAKLSDAKTKSSNILESVKKLSIDGFPGNLQTMKLSQNAMHIVIQDLRAAQNSM